MTFASRLHGQAEAAHIQPWPLLWGLGLTLRLRDRFGGGSHT